MEDLEYVIDTGLTWPLSRSRRKQTDHIQIHHTVGNYGTPSKWAALHKKHIEEKGNRGVPYSYLVTADGEIYLGRGHPYAHGAVTASKTLNESGVSANDRSIAIAINGDMQSPDRPTSAQMVSLERLVKDLLQMYSLTPAQVLGHNEVIVYRDKKRVGTYATLCPCLDMAAFRAKLQNQKPAPVPKPDPEPEPEEAESPYPCLCQYGGDTFVNLRLGPGTDHKKIGVFAKGQTAILLDKSNNWAEIVTHETIPIQRGWCGAKYVLEL